MISHPCIALFLIAFKHECVHLRFDKVDRFIATKVIFGLPPEILNLALHFVDFGINLFEVGTELRINDIIVLLGFSDIYALLEHFTQLCEILKRAFELIEDLSAQRMMLIHHMLVQVTTQLLQSKDHVVNLHTVNQLGIVSELGLHSVEFGIKLFKIRKL